MNPNRIAQLEEHVAHLEVEIEAINKALIAKERGWRQLQETVSHLQAQLGAYLADQPTPPDHESPPNY